MKNAWKAFRTWFLANKISNTLAAVVTFAFSVPAFVTAFHNWAIHQPADWRMACFSVVMAAALAIMKDSGTHSTVEQTVTATNNQAAGK